MTTAINYYNNFATEYDTLASEYHWISPKIMYGMLYDKFESGNKILDVGIGTGLSSIPFNKSGAVIYGVDGSENMLTFCDKKSFAKELKLVNIETDDLPYNDNYFTIVISNGVCYFVKDLYHYISECVRVLIPGGIFSFNYEEFNDGISEEYLNYSNCAISKKLKDKTGVTVFKYNPEHIMNVLQKFDLAIEEVVRYFAYKSPTTKEDVYFTLLILRKIK